MLFRAPRPRSWNCRDLTLLSDSDHTNHQIPKLNNRAERETGTPDPRPLTESGPNGIASPGLNTWFLRLLGWGMSFGGLV